MKMNKQLSIVLFLVIISFLNLSCSEDDELTELSPEQQCFNFWLNGNFQSRSYRSGNINITQNNVTCSYEALLSISINQNRDLSITIGPNVNSIFDLCDTTAFFTINHIITPCNGTQFLNSERNYPDGSKDVIFIVRDIANQSYEGSSQRYENIDGTETLVSESIFSVPY